MGKEWESSRIRRERREHMRNLMLWATMLILIGLAYATASQPLPSNMERAATSKAMLDYLKEANR